MPNGSRWGFGWFSYLIQETRKDLPDNHPRCDTVFAYWFTLMLEISQWSMEALDGG
jgi:hypothetical protein